MPLLKVEITVEAMVYVPPLSDAEKAGKTERQQDAILVAKAEDLAISDLYDITQTEVATAHAMGPIVAADLQPVYEGSLPWGVRRGLPERTCEQILADEAAAIAAKEPAHG